MQCTLPISCIYKGVGAGPAGPVLAGQLFRRFKEFAPITITTGPLQKSFLHLCHVGAWLLRITDYMQQTKLMTNNS